MTLFSAAAPLHIPAVAQHVYDVTGAGDTVIATLTAAVAGALALTDSWRTMWPAFGASNQLVAALALLVVPGARGTGEVDDADPAERTAAPPASGTSAATARPDQPSKSKACFSASKTAASV